MKYLLLLVILSACGGLIEEPSSRLPFVSCAGDCDCSASVPSGSGLESVRLYSQIGGDCEVDSDARYAECSLAGHTSTFAWGPTYLDYEVFGVRGETLTACSYGQ